MGATMGRLLAWLATVIVGSAAGVALGIELANSVLG